MQLHISLIKKVNTLAYVTLKSSNLYTF